MAVHRRLRASLARFSLALGSLAHASLARFTSTRFQFSAFHFSAMPVWRVSLWRVSHFCAYADPVSAKASFARTIFLISAEKSCLCLFARRFPFCEEVFSTPVSHVSLFACARSVSICAHVY